ncbi:MAG: DegV family protein [Eubacterium sp.]|nr:DegV family protein [Eubacterium sp.]
MNKEKIAVLTDSCADIPRHLIEAHDIHVLPLKIAFEGKTYTDGVDITPAEVCQRIKAELPKTSLPSPQEVQGLYQKIYDEGYRKVFALSLSSALSGTYNLVKLTGEQFQGLEVYAADTKSGSLGTGAIALHVAELIEAGESFEAIKALIPRLIENTHVYFSVDTLEYLQKGGRIGKITAAAGTLLNVKPIISFDAEGQLVSVAKLRGRKKSLQKMAALAAGHFQPGKRCKIMVANGGCPDEMAAVKGLYTELLPDYEALYEGEVDSTLSAHVGPNLLGAGILLLDA